MKNLIPLATALLCSVLLSGVVATQATWTSTNYAVGTGPRDVAVGDFDGATGLDIATANSSSDNVTILPNDGSAGFGGTATTIAVGGANTEPTGVAFGDLDDDGSVDDLAVACADSDTIVLIDDPAGTPVLTTIASAGLRPIDCASGDLDAADATDDVVAAREGELINGGGGIDVILNGGAATDLAIPGGSPTKVVKIALCDLDDDGDLDIAAVAQGTGGDEILLYTNDGTGTFTTAGVIALSTSGQANGLCCGDLDGDGDNDLAVVLPVIFPTVSMDVQIYQYAASGALDPTDYTGTALISATGTFGTDAACGDIQDDSIPGFLSRVDLVVANTGSGDVEMFDGFDGTGGTFSGSATPSSGTSPAAIAVADFDGDGEADIAVANQGSNNVSVNVTDATALATSYGAGCAGTGGNIPAIAAAGSPTSGNGSFGVGVSNALANAPALLAFSTDIDTTTLGGGCDLLLLAPVLTQLTFTDGAGAATVTVGIPTAAAALGTDAYFQYAVFDANGAFGGVIAMSDALRIQIGI